MAAQTREPYLSARDHAERGKAARVQCDRSSHANWNPAPDRADPVDLLAKQAESRVPELVPIRYGRMLESPFAFYRGAAVIMAADLAAAPHTGLHVQLCGDAHISNFGGFASPERELVLDINDFDETLTGPWEWDVKRLAASVEIAGRERGFDAAVSGQLVRAAVGEYQRAMNEFAAKGNLAMWCLHMAPAEMHARWGATAQPKSLKALDAEFARAHSHDNVRAYEKLTERVGDRIRIVARPPLVVPIEDLAPDAALGHLDDTIHKLIHQYVESLQPDLRHLLAQYRFVHMARKVVGVGSVGTRTYVILMLGRDEADPLFLQVKEAQASVLEAYLGKSVYAEHGKRVVEGQRLMQAASDIFLGWTRAQEGIDGRAHDYYVRQLWDWKLSMDVATMTVDEISVYVRMCAWTLARSHARSGDRIAISAYLGKNAMFEHALAEFATAYADQNQRDYHALVDAVKTGRINASRGE